MALHIINFKKSGNRCNKKDSTVFKDGIFNNKIFIITNTSSYPTKAVLIHYQVHQAKEQQQ